MPASTRYHIISRDLAHWQIISTTPDRAMLSPDMPYDNHAVMTGSVTVVNGTPTALYSCRGSAEVGATARRDVHVCMCVVGCE